MAITSTHTHGAVCFVADGISYKVTESPGDNNPKLFTFQVDKYDSANNTTTETISLLCYPTSDTQGNSIFDIDISDIISAYLSKYSVQGGYIYGYVKVQLTRIGEETFSDQVHICLPGTSGGIDFQYALPKNQHPFLLARGNELGSLHFYRSELRAMGIVLLLNTYNYTNIHVETDNHEYSEDLARINNSAVLFGISINDGDYDLTQDNAIFVQLSRVLGFAARQYTLAIQEDPDTDEIYLLRWTNSMGAQEAILLTGELQDISEIDKQDLYITEQTLQHVGRKQSRSLVTTKYSLQTGYLTPARIIALRDLLSSEDVEMQIDDEWIPVSVTADTKHAVHQREPEYFELTIEVLKQTRYHKPNRTVNPLPGTRSALLQNNEGNIILDNNSNTIEENG